MKAFKLILAALSATVALVACTKNEVGGLEREDGKMTLSVTGVLGEYKAAEGTKASLVNTPRVGWSGNETVHVFQQSDGMYLGSLTSSVTAPGASVAKLGGTVSSGTGTLVFVYTNATVPSLTEGSTYTSLEISLASQGADIPFVVYGTADSPGTETVSGLVVNFSFATSVVSTYAAGLPAGKEVTQAALDSINTACSLSITGGGTPSGSEPGTITKTAGIGSTNDDGQVLFEIAVPVSEAASSGRNVEFTIGTGTCTTAFSNAAIEAGKSYSAMSENHSVEAVVLGKASTTIFLGAPETLTATVYPSNSTNKAVTWTSSNGTIATVNENGIITGKALGTAIITATSQEDPTIKATCTVTVDNHEYVVIGGLKWATCNIGAGNPSDKGWHFSWGNTEGYVHNGTNWVKASDSSKTLGTDGKFSETNYNSTPGHSLSGDISPASVNDAARINWGGDWRMPTKEDFKKLYDACGGTGTPETGGSKDTKNKGVYWCTSYDGVAGLLFIAEDNGPHLFFPAAGYGYGTDLFDAGDGGNYWSSSLDSGGTDYAYYLEFYSYGVDPQDINDRYYGFPVRPVSE